MIKVIQFLAVWPLGLLQACGAILGWCAYWGSKPYRQRLNDHAGLAGLSGRQRRSAVAHAGRMAAELPWLWMAPPQRSIDRWVRWSEPQRVDAALQKGQGLILLTPHLGSFEVCAQAYAQRWGAKAPLTALYRPARQAWLRAVQERSRARPGLKTAPANLAGVRAMVRALRQGETIGMLPDQVPPEGLGVWAPFWGRPAYTMTLASRLVQQTGAAVVVLWGERLPAGAGWVVHALEPEALWDGSQAWSAEPEQINRLMERVIALAPEQYLWAYHRYKQPRSSGGLA